MLLAFTEEGSTEAERRVLAATVGNPQATAEEVSRVRDIMESTGARESVEGLIRTREDNARDVVARELSTLTSRKACELLDSLVRQLARTGR